MIIKISGKHVWVLVARKIIVEIIARVRDARETVTGDEKIQQRGQALEARVLLFRDPEDIKSPARQGSGLQQARCRFGHVVYNVAAC